MMSESIAELHGEAWKLWLDCANDEVAHALHDAMQSLATAQRVAQREGV